MALGLEDRANLLVEADLVSSGIFSGCQGSETDTRPQQSESTRAEHERHLQHENRRARRVRKTRRRHKAGEHQRVATRKRSNQSRYHQTHQRASINFGWWVTTGCVANVGGCQEFQHGGTKTRRNSECLPRLVKAAHRETVTRTLKNMVDNNLPE